MTRLLIFSLLVALLTGCAGVPAATVTPSPPATASPSAPTASETPVGTPTPFPTFELVLPTQTPTLEPGQPTPTPSEPAAGEFDCRLLSQGVKNGAHFAPRERFDMAWHVRNTGTVLWDPASVDFVFLGGTKMYASSSSKLQASVDPDQKALLVADLMAPRQEGKFTTFWSLRSGQYYFCKLSLTINVP